MRVISFAEAFSLVGSLVSAALIERQSTATSIYKATGSGAWIECIAVRPNGNLLLTRLDVPELWNLDPTTKAATKLFTFSSAQSLTGITELTPDVFAVVTGSFNVKSFAVKAGSWGVYKVDLTATPTSTLVKNVPESGFFVGATTFDNDTIFVADAGKGSLYKMTISTGDYSVVLTDASMKAPASAAIQEGIHGIKYYEGEIYFTNTFGDTFNKIKVDPATGKTSGSVTSILTGLSGPEDVAIGPDGTTYVALMTKGQILKVTPDGKSTVAGSVSSSTAPALGRTIKDNSTLYVGTSSGQVYSIALS